MGKTMTVRRMGDSLGSVFPKEVTDRLKIEEGDTLFIVECKDGILLTPNDPTFEKMKEGYEDLSKRYRNALRELAK